MVDEMTQITSMARDYQYAEEQLVIIILSSRELYEILWHRLNEVNVAKLGGELRYVYVFPKKFIHH